MKTPICQLDDFYFTHLEVKWNEPDTVTDVTSLTSKFDYDVFRKKENTRHYMLRFQSAFEEKTKDDAGVGFEIESTLVGLISFQEGTCTDDCEKIVRLNGVALLWGVLRGQLAAMTGSFPGGKFSLPTIMPDEIVTMVEARKAEKAKPAKKKATKKVATKPTKKTAKKVKAK